MLTLLSALGSMLAARVRSCASLELELVALRHQVTLRAEGMRSLAEELKPAGLGVAA